MTSLNNLEGESVKTINLLIYSFPKNMVQYVREFNTENHGQLKPKNMMTSLKNLQ